MAGPPLSEIHAHFGHRTRLWKTPRPRGLSEQQARSLTVGDRVVYSPTGVTGTVEHVSFRGVVVKWANGVDGWYMCGGMQDIRRA